MEILNIDNAHKVLAKDYHKYDVEVSPEMTPYLSKENGKTSLRMLLQKTQTHPM